MARAIVCARSIPAVLAVFALCLPSAITFTTSRNPALQSRILAGQKCISAHRRPILLRSRALSESEEAELAEMKGVCMTSARCLKRNMWFYRLANFNRETGVYFSKIWQKSGRLLDHGWVQHMVQRNQTNDSGYKFTVSLRNVLQTYWIRSVQR